MYATGATLRPVDFDSGSLLKDGRVIQDISPGHRGRGGFTYIVEEGSIYELKVDAGGQELSYGLYSSGEASLGILLKSGAVITDKLEVELQSNSQLIQRE